MSPNSNTRGAVLGQIKSTPVFHATCSKKTHYSVLLLQDATHTHTLRTGLKIFVINTRPVRWNSFDSFLTHFATFAKLVQEIFTLEEKLRPCFFFPLLLHNFAYGIRRITIKYYMDELTYMYITSVENKKGSGIIIMKYTPVGGAHIQGGMKTIFTATIPHSQLFMPNITLSGQACFVRWKNQFIFVIHKCRFSLYGTGNYAITCRSLHYLSDRLQSYHLEIF